MCSELSSCFRLNCTLNHWCGANVCKFTLYKLRADQSMDIPSSLPTMCATQQKENRAASVFTPFRSFYCCMTLLLLYFVFLFRRVFCDRNAYIRYEYGICVGFSIKFANVSFSSSSAHSIRSTWPNIKCVYWMSALHSHNAVCMNGKSAFNIIKSTMYYAIGRVRRYISTIKHNKNGWSSDSLGCIGANSV